MGITTALHHITEYSYDQLIELGPQTIRLRPAPHTRSHIQSYSLKITPEKHFINWQQDPFGNYLARVVFPEKTKQLRVEVDLVTEVKVFNPFDFFLEEEAKNFPFHYSSELQDALQPYLEIKEHGQLLNEWLQTIKTDTQSIIDFLVYVNQSLNQQLEYCIRLEQGVQTCESTLKKGSGSCRDMAWLLCQGLRHLGIATRFASGYLIQLKADVQPLEDHAGPESDFTDLHAWTEVYLPGAGWIGLDPTSGLFAGEGHIPLCCTPNPASAAPISGALGPCESTMLHEMRITRLHEDRRATKPYTEQQWQHIDNLGQQVDAILNSSDICLTMGGEPTFVSTENPDHDAWNFAALSTDKKQLGKKLLWQLKDNFSNHSLLQIGQGKWYPGETLPRWAMHCFWRKDAEPLWQQPTLLADPDVDHAHTLEIGHQFLKTLAQKLGIPSAYVLPAFEDRAYYLHKQQQLPKTLAEKDKQDNSEYQRINKILAKDPNEPAGYVLPLHYSPTRQGWISNRWQFNTSTLTLGIGDSPIGLRLPLKSLPDIPEKDNEYIAERNSLEQVDPLPSYAELTQQLSLTKQITDDAFSKDPNGLIHSACCVEIRQGTIHLFLPPTIFIEHFLILIHTIEAVAKQLDTPIVLEGYNPPTDIRIQKFSITPDPGVLEVNIQPANNWQELKNIIYSVYAETHQLKLTTEKFLLDGRRVGTGGGNHIVMGAETVENSPFLRRPDLLRSLLSFWQNHPALSYLFSSEYIGPTSQAPRVDEARHDSLYELEIAFKRISDYEETPPWLVDRLFRNLLVDLTGNTHRAEFCIDKLYNPASTTGRLGLLEMRGFEMTPHPQMNLLQALLLRALVACFWQQPYQHKLIPWGTQLHDKFMLPHYIQEDFHDVLNFLNHAGFDFEYDWFEPFMDFRFPVYGRIHADAISLELRMALEPWPVLGEEVTASGVSRAVDTSVERLQVKATGITNDRYILTCNGYTIPLKTTAEKDVYVGGVRYKAWQQASSLHPTIAAHAPLVFDIIDTYFARSIGGCTYHVGHPGGRNYETRPINGNEAEGRRLSRFESMGHTPGPVEIQAAKINSDFPYTLDLRLSSANTVKHKNFRHCDNSIQEPLKSKSSLP